MKITELREQTVTLLPDREALGRSHGGFTFTKVYASNTSLALNFGSWGAEAESAAVQNIRIG